MTLGDAARQVGGHCWLELQVFEIAGSWVPATPDRHAKLALDRHAAHAAWRAEQWRERLPVLAGMDREALMQAPDERWSRCMTQVAAMDGDVAGLAGLYRVVVPRLARRYRQHLSASSPVAEGPTRRTLRMVLADLGADREEGDDAVMRLLIERPAVAAAAAAVAQLELAFVDALADLA